MPKNKRKHGEDSDGEDDGEEGGDKVGLSWPTCEFHS
jgi:hypothetical protein